jgi:ankyrin repeat protein
MSRNRASVWLVIGVLGCSASFSKVCAETDAGLAIIKAFEAGECKSDWRNAKTSNDRLWVAARCGSLPSARDAVSSGADIQYRRSWYYTLRDMTPLHMAALEGHADIVQVLLQHRADPKATNPDLFTPLHAAARRGHAAAAALLLKAGADPNAMDQIFGTPLHEAVQRGHPEVVRLLLKAGASPDLRDAKRGATALHMIGWNIVFERGHEQAMDLLLAAGANRNLPNKEGLTPLDYVIRNPNKPAIKPMISRGFKRRAELEAIEKK